MDVSRRCPSSINRAGSAIRSSRSCFGAIRWSPWPANRAPDNAETPDNAEPRARDPGFDARSWPTPGSATEGSLWRSLESGLHDPDDVAFGVGEQGDRRLRGDGGQRHDHATAVALDAVEDALWVVTVNVERDVAGA